MMTLSVLDIILYNLQLDGITAGADLKKSLHIRKEIVRSMYSNRSKRMYVLKFNISQDALRGSL